MRAARFARGDSHTAISYSTTANPLAWQRIQPYKHDETTMAAASAQRTEDQRKWTRWKRRLPGVVNAIPSRMLGTVQSGSCGANAVRVDVRAGCRLGSRCNQRARSLEHADWKPWRLLRSCSSTHRPGENCAATFLSVARNGSSTLVVRALWRRRRDALRESDRRERRRVHGRSAWSHARARCGDGPTAMEGGRRSRCPNQIDGVLRRPRSLFRTTAREAIGRASDGQIL